MGTPSSAPALRKLRRDASHRALLRELARIRQLLEGQPAGQVYDDLMVQNCQSIVEMVQDLEELQDIDEGRPFPEEYE